MSVIKITVDDQNLHIIDSPKIAAQGVNENYVEFTFSDDWDGFGKTAHFYIESDPETIYTSVVSGNGYALIPHEITANEGRICLGLSGVNDDVVKTTEILTYRVVKGLYVAESAEPSPGTYEQMLTIVGEIQAAQASFESEIEADQASFESEVETNLSGMEASIAEIESETSSSIDTIDARVDNFINGTRPGSVTTLWTGSIMKKNDAATLSANVSGFDFLDIYFLNGIDTKFIRVPASQTSLQIQAQNMSDDGSSSFLYLWETGVTLSGTTVTINKCIWWKWNNPGTDSPTVTADAENGPAITRIDGVKMSDESPAELLDIRVGADSTTYGSAGAAVRGQISSLNGNITNLNKSLNGRITNLNKSLTSEENRAKAEEQRLEELFTAPTQEAVDEWLDNHPEATTSVEDGSLSLIKFRKGSTSFVIPDMFDGASDSDKLENAVSYVISREGGIILINREYVLTRDTILKNNSDGNKVVSFVGLNAYSLINTQTYSFVGDSEYGASNGGFRFENIRFYGSGNCFKSPNLIRLNISSCFFSNYTSIFRIVNNNDYLQSIRLDKCTIRNSTYIISALAEITGIAYDVHLTNNIIEWITGVINGDIVYRGLYCLNNCIEGLSGTAFILGNNCYGINIANNYFENNANVFDFSLVPVDSDISVSIMNNNFIETSDTSDPIIYLPRYDFNGKITLTNNSVYPDTVVFAKVLPGTSWTHNVESCGNGGIIDDSSHKMNQIDFNNLLSSTPGVEYVLHVSVIGVAVTSGVIYAPILLSNFISSTTYDVLGIYNSTVVNVGNGTSTVLSQQKNALEIQTNISGLTAGHSYLCRYSVGIKITIPA